MKKIYKLLVAFVLCATALVLTACDSDAPYVTIQSATAIREKVTIDFTMWDEDVILEELVLTITGTVDGEDYEDTSRVSITGGKYATEEDINDEISLEDFIGETETISFEGLEIGETYSVTFTATYNGKAKKITPIIDEGKNINLSNLTTSSAGGSIDSPHEITSTEDFDLIRNDPDGFFVLMNDIDCDGNAISPFYTSSKKFVGNFDGNEKEISNFKQDNYDQYLGLFGYIDNGGVLKDLTVSSANLNSLRHSKVYIGAVTGYNAGEITNVHAKDITISTNGSSTGEQYIGGFVGYNIGTAIIDKCTVETLTIDLNLPASARIGGFAGTNERNNNGSPVISNSTVDGALLDIQIENDMQYTTDGEIEIELSIGGFIGDNKSIVDTCETTDVDILVYVKGTKTDGDHNYAPEDGGTSAFVLNETERNSYVDSMKLRVGGFVGLNDTGLVTSSKSSLNSVVIEAAYLDYIYLGGFAGYNSAYSYISACTVVGAGFDVIVGEDTNLDTNTFGSKIGLDNSMLSSTFSNSTTSTFTVKRRVYDSTDADSGIKKYVLESVIVNPSN